MTIFDSIRYPISLPPTKEQLEALPQDIFEYWIDKHTADWHRQGSDIRYSTDLVASWMNRLHCSTSASDEIKTDTAALRKLILEWDQPI